jgi:hypothetical protein
LRNEPPQPHGHRTRPPTDGVDGAPIMRP